MSNLPAANENNFDAIKFRTLSIADKLKDFESAIVSIRGTLQPDRPLEDLELPYLSTLKIELRIYLSMFGSVVDEGYPEMEISDIEYVEDKYKSASAIYKALEDAIEYLCVAYEALEFINEEKAKKKTFSMDLKKNYYRHISGCRSALITITKNFES